MEKNEQEKDTFQGAPLFLLVTFKIQWTFDQGCHLESMSMTVFFCPCAGKMHVFPIANFDSRGGCTTKFMEMAISKVCAEFDFMHMAVTTPNCFTGYSSKTMVMAFLFFVENSCAAGDFVNVALSSAVIAVIILAPAIAAIELTHVFFSFRFGLCYILCSRTKKGV